MVAYSFKSFFAPQISSGEKCQTIRSDRPRHARPGERVQLYQGMRTKHCRKIIDDQVCTKVLPIEISISEMIDQLVASIVVDGIHLNNGSIEMFARADGFAPEFLGDLIPAKLRGQTARETMGRFWLANHPGQTKFNGVLIRWQPEAPTP